VEKELIAKLQSGEILPDKELAIMFIKNNREIEETSTNFVSSIFNSIAISGIFLFILLCFHSIFIYRVLRSSNGT